LLRRLRNLPRVAWVAALVAAASAGGFVFMVSGGARGDVAAIGRVLHLMPRATTPLATVTASARSAQPPTAASHGDILDRLRAAHTPALERVILETARAAVESAAAQEEGASHGGITASGKRGESSDLGDLDGAVDESVLRAPAGVFVALILNGSVRGCMGTAYPMEASLLEEVASAARMAATCDPRRPPVRPEEVSRLGYCVSVVGRLRRHDPREALDPSTQGVIVRADGGRTGVVLPGEARTAAYETAWAMREAGVLPGDHFDMLIFETERFGEALPLRR
jgi:AMMECR1 domain-containing protein